MTSLVLMFTVVVALLAHLVIIQVVFAKERERLINRIIARTPTEVRVLDETRIDTQPRTRSKEEEEFLTYFTGQTGI